MITAEIRDAGTFPQISRAVVPGMDRLRWVEFDCEEDWNGQRRGEISTNMMFRRPLALAPWPLEIGRHAPLDRTPLYEGLTWRLHQRVQQLPEGHAAAWAPVPEGRAVLSDTVDINEREEVAVSRFSTPEEVRSIVEQPTKWLRLPFDNEGGQCHLVEPALLMWRGLQNSRFALELEDNDLFTPYDLTKPERYAYWTDEGQRVEAGHLYALLADRERVVLYQRPRRWRIFVKVIAHFVHITPFEMVENDEVFLEVYYHRPPFFPVRFDQANVGVDVFWHQYEGQMLAYDAGLEWQWEHSRAAQDMRHAIVAQQVFTLCFVYMFIGAEPAVVTVWRVPPAVGEVVLGVGRIDQATGVESRVWVVQEQDVSQVYQQTLLDVFWADFAV